jgi:hypothetical protein
MFFYEFLACSFGNFEMKIQNVPWTKARRHGARHVGPGKSKHLPGFFIAKN